MKKISKKTLKDLIASNTDLEIDPMNPEKFNKTYEEFLSQVNQLQFFASKLGRDIEEIEDTKEIFTSLKKVLSQYLELQRTINIVVDSINKIKIPVKNEQITLDLSIPSNKESTYSQYQITYNKMNEDFL